MLAVLIGLGFRKLKPQMPVVRSNSLAIAAQCCRPDDDVDAAFLPVSWGEVSDEPGRLCFTSKIVHAPGQQMSETTGPEEDQLEDATEMQRRRSFD